MMSVSPITVYYFTKKCPFKKENASLFSPHNFNHEKPGVVIFQREVCPWKVAMRKYMSFWCVRPLGASLLEFRPHGHLSFVAHFIAQFLLRRIFSNVHGHFSTHFPRRDVCAEKLTCYSFPTRRMRVNTRRGKCAGSSTHANKMRRIDAENVW